MYKKVLICSNIYPPSFIGGAEIIAHNQAKALKKLGCDVVVFAGDTEGSKERYSILEDRFEGITVYRIRLVHEDFQNSGNNFIHRQVEDKFNELLDKFSPEVVHFHNIVGLSATLIRIAKCRGIKTVVTLHDYWGFCYKNTIVSNNGGICEDFSQCHVCLPEITIENFAFPLRMRKDVFDIVMESVDIFISPSRYLADTYIRAGFPKEKIQVVWNGIEIERFSSIVRNTNEREIRLTYVGYFGAHKGINILIDALSMIDPKNNFILNLVGDGDQLENYKRQLKKIDCMHLVKFWGKIPNSQIDKVYSETDILVLPSLWPENQPVSITEAMASKIPVIASRIGGSVELVEDGFSGFLFEPGNAEQLAQKLLEFYKDPDKLKTFGENAYRKIKDNSYENQVYKINEIYDTLVENKKYNSFEAIICVGKGGDNDIYHAILNKFSSCKFILYEWLESLNQNVKAILFTDNIIEFDPILFAINNKIPIIVPEKNILLKNLCIHANCGLYYSNKQEAEECIKYLLYNEKMRVKIGDNCYKLAKYV